MHIFCNGITKICQLQLITYYVTRVYTKAKFYYTCGVGGRHILVRLDCFLQVCRYTDLQEALQPYQYVLWADTNHTELCMVDSTLFEPN